MRLHSLRLRAFGPFVAEQVVDFEPLGAGGLFLLDGPTGAGKSTVLDAITFALYGPGDGGGWGRLHSHFAAPSDEPRVVLEFSLRGVRQRVTRSPEYRRPKRRGDGTTLEKAQVHLQRLEGGRWVSRSSRKDEVAEMLCDDIGLTREQFTQVVLLPQGEFMRFLQASDDERRTLLTKLFGTGLYDRITDELDRRRIVASRELEASEKLVGVQLGAVAATAGLDGDARAALAACPVTERDAYLDVRAAQLASTAATGVRDAELAEQVLTDRRSAAAAAETLAHQMQRLVDAIDQHRVHEAGRGEFELASAALAAADRAAALRPLVRQYEDSGDAVAKARAAVARAGVGEQGVGEQGVGEQGVGVRGVGVQPGDLRVAATDRSREAAELTHLVVSERELAGRSAELALTAAVHARAERELAGITLRVDRVPAELGAAVAAVRAGRDDEVALPGLVERRDALAARLDAVARLADVEPRRIAAQRHRERAFAGFERAAAHHRHLAEARLANMAAELAGRLVDGAACAVCGALEHPAPAPAVPGAAGAAEVETADGARARAEHAYELARVDSERLDRRCAELAAAAALDGVDPAQLRVEFEQCGTAATAAQQHAAGLPSREAALARLELEAAALTDAQRAASAAVTTAAARLDALQHELDRSRAELLDAAAGHPSVAARQEALRAEAASLTQRADAYDRLRGVERDHEANLVRALAEAAAVGFTDLAEVESASLDPAELAGLRTLVADWQAHALRLRGAREAAESGGLDSDDAEAVFAAARETAQALPAVELTSREAAVRAARASDAHERFLATRERLDTAQREYDALEQAARTVVHLARLAKGVAGQRRVALTTYVLRQWFEQVVAAANVRLAGMSSGRYELVRVDEGASRAERVGLTVCVLDRHTGEQRSARSLSGGETFYTSLALALGLADVVRAEAGGVDLDTLFIDEGFGSLDADTLDQVMGVIDELRDRGRTVGIVSHVSELKNRIAERIEVRRLPDGSSAVRQIA